VSPESAKSPLRICTRKSPLAMWQAETLQALLAARGVATELVPLSTKGDRVLDRALSEVGGKGLFVKELEEALLDGRADVAVHSAKDVPFALEDRFVLCAFPLREDPRDALVAPAARTFAHLPQGARVGTSSLRRAVQLLQVRPDLQIVPVRGNVATRLSRATGVRADGSSVDAAERLDAVVLALAGLRRLGLDSHATDLLSVELSLPAAGQGALALEVARGSRAEAICAALNDEKIARCVRAERAVLAHLGGSCTVPVGAHALLETAGDGSSQLFLRAVLGGASSGDTRALASGSIRLLRAEGRGPAEQPEALGVRIAEQLLAQGGGAMLAASAAGAAGLPAPKRSGETP